jgi:hypothetical protein
MTRSQHALLSCLFLLVLLPMDTVAQRPPAPIDLVGVTADSTGARERGGGAAVPTVLAGLPTLQIPGPTLDQWKEILRILTTSGFTEEMLRLYFGVDLAGIPQVVADGWAVVSPALTQARVLAGGFATSEAALVAAPTLLVALVAASIIPQAVLQARMQSSEMQGLDDMRKWQTEQEILEDVFRRRRKGSNWIRIPSFTNTADIIVTGPGAGEISAENFQNYLQAAGRARGNPSKENLKRAMAALQMIQLAASLWPEE